MFKRYFIVLLIPTWCNLVEPPIKLSVDMAPWEPTSALGKDMNSQINNTWFSVQVQFSSVTQSRPTICDPMDCSTPGLPVHHQLTEFTQTHAHRDGNAIQPSHPLSSPSPPTFNLSQRQSLFKWVSSSDRVAKVLEFQPQHQSFQWTFRTDLL